MSKQRSTIELQTRNTGGVGGIRTTHKNFSKVKAIELPQPSYIQDDVFAMLCYHYITTPKLGTVDGNQTRHTPIDSRLSPSGELYGIKLGGYTWDLNP